MNHVRVSHLKDHEGQEVTVRGWLHNRRSSGKIQFHLVRDGSGLVQCVVRKNAVDEALFARLDSLGQESSVEVSGTVRLDPRAPGGAELTVTAYRVEQAAENYPIQPQEHGADFLLSHRHLWLRSSKQHAQHRVRDELIKAARDWLYDHEFINMDSPILTPAACEGTTTLFELPYFELGSAFLTQSGQLYAEACAMAHGKVYCFGPTFRAERSKTRRHLTEFWMLEPEIAWAGLDDVMEIEEQLIGYLVERVLERRKEDLKVLERDTNLLERYQPPFPRLQYDDAVKLLHEQGREFAWGGDFGAPDEDVISRQYDRPVFVHRFPAAIKAFYMKEDPKDSRLSLSVDLLAPEGVGEITGGGQREESIEVLERKLAEHKLPKEPYEWYLDLRRYGSVPHAGFGMGLERTTAWICGVEHVRETIPFPRMIYRIYP